MDQSGGMHKLNRCCHRLKRLDIIVKKPPGKQGKSRTDSFAATAQAVFQHLRKPAKIHLYD